MRLKRGTFVLAVAVGVVIAMLGSAHAATSTSVYTAKADPSSVVAGVATDVTLTLTNATRSSQSLGSAHFNAPRGWTVNSPASQAARSTFNKAWTVTTSATQVQFGANTNGDALAPGDSVKAQVNVTATCSATGGSWQVVAKQSNNFQGTGNDFSPASSLDANPPASTTSGTLAHFAFTPQPGTQTVGAPFTIKITAQDGSGNTLPCYGGPATLSGLSGSPTYGTFSWLAGVGSASVTAAVSETARLTATAGTVSDTSNSFSILALTCDSTTSAQDCHASDTSGKTQVNGATPPSGATLGLGFTPPAGSFSCGTANSPLAGSSLVQVMPSGYGDGYVTVTLDYDKSIAPGTGVANFNVCILKPAPTGWLLLNSCSKSAPPCVASRSRTGVGDLLIVLTIPGSDPLIGTG